MIWTVQSDMLDVRGYTSTAAGANVASDIPSASTNNSSERDVTHEIVKIKDEANATAHKRRRTNDGPADPTPVVYLDHSGDEEQMRAPRKLPIKTEPSSASSAVRSTVISLLDSDGE
ncbi:hypothetical protein H9P43_000841 [Blastocladiella emersonii ATCC 22665]|nr:hypothetical protein H9P43_000841 [Blastocladiella emersonii ATCC 22665]